jgi:membrane protein required for beta-lactamase induction
MAGNVKVACRERGLLQALRRYGSCEEWKCARLSTLSLPLVRLQFHNDAAAWQAACDESAGLLLYAMGNVSFGSIARILGVSDVAVLNWVRDEARKLPEPSTKAEVVVVTLDEMWRFVKKD